MLSKLINECEFGTALLKLESSKINGHFFPLSFFFYFTRSKVSKTFSFFFCVLTTGTPFLFSYLCTIVYSTLAPSPLFVLYLNLLPVMDVLNLVQKEEQSFYRQRKRLLAARHVRKKRKKDTFLCYFSIKRWEMVGSAKCKNLSLPQQQRHLKRLSNVYSTFRSLFSRLLELLLEGAQVLCTASCHRIIDHLHKRSPQEPFNLFSLLLKWSLSTCTQSGRGSAGTRNSWLLKTLIS